MVELIPFIYDMMLAFIMARRSRLGILSIPGSVPATLILCR